jgi:hypothetical protein
MTDTLTELERLHGAAGEPIVAIFDESRVVDFITITVGGVRVDELPESEQDALGRYAIALLNNGSELLKQARLAATLTSILCTDEGQDVVGRAKALARFDKPRAAVGGEYTEGTIAELAQRCEVLIAEEQEKPLPDNALISVLCNTVRLTRECERFPPMGVVNELRAALAAKDAELDTHDAARVIAQELLHAEYYRRAPGGDAASALFRYIAQAELVEKERDELKAKLAYETKRAFCPGCVDGEENARLAAVVKTHGPRLADILAMVLRSEGVRREFGGLDPEEQAAAKAFAEALK